MSAMKECKNSKKWMSMIKKSKIDGAGISELWALKQSPNRAKLALSF